MAANPFLQVHYEREPEWPPRRLYARFEQIADGVAVLETVGADWFDETGRRAETLLGWARVAEDAPIFVLEVAFPWAQDFRDWSRAEARRFRPPQWPWFSVLVDPEGHIGRAAPAMIFHNLYAPGRETVVGDIEAIDTPTAQALEQTFSLTPHIKTQDEIEAALSGLAGRIDWVGVYDVGQGSANGLCDGNETPLGYFDLGGGVKANSFTFPTSALTDVCYANAPPVVLSHWDWDHWSSGNRFAGAQALKWVAPFQGLGTVHGTFAATLAAAGNLLVWPTGLTLPQVKIGQVTVHKCTGSGRNHSGLAIEVEGPGGEAAILLPGDARYSAIPPALTGTYTSVITPHHGATMKLRKTPLGTGLPGARAAYSVGPANTFFHPTLITETNHNRQGWPHSHFTFPGIDRRTDTQRPGLGHIGLSWTATPALPGHRCGQAGCAVGLVQI